jgi:hypothetical protein
MRNLLLIAALSTQLIAFAQTDSPQPEIIPDFYGLKMSNDGNIMISETDGETMAVYNRLTDDYQEYSLCSRGLGNSIADDGTIVGSTLEDKPFIITDGEMVIPESLTKNALCNFHGITPDGSRICGLVSNPKSTGSTDEANLMYLPMYVDVTEGKVSEPVILPCPEKDFVGLTPQYCTAVWISSDGRTILGQVIDFSGFIPYPIIYRQAADGTWSYSLPTKDLLNPDNLTLPPYPVEPEEPVAEEYMDEDMRVEYATDLAEWEASGYVPEMYPDPVDYMSEEKRNEYQEAMALYTREVGLFNKKLRDYLTVREEIFDASVPFVQNAMTMNSAGSMVAATSSVTKAGEFQPEKYFSIFIFDLDADSFRSIETGKTGINPNKIVTDGTILCSSSSASDYVPRGYMIKKGSAELMPVQEYLGSINPVYETWLTDHLSLNVFVEDGDEYIEETLLVTGMISASDDLSVIAGSVPSYLFEEEEYLYYTYVFDRLTSGVNNVKADGEVNVSVLNDGIVNIAGNVTDFRIMDMEGRTLLHLNEASGNIATGLRPGLYIISYNADGNHHAIKLQLHD